MHLSALLVNSVNNVITSARLIFKLVISTSPQKPITGMTAVASPYNQECIYDLHKPQTQPYCCFQW